MFSDLRMTGFGLPQPWKVSLSILIPKLSLKSICHTFYARVFRPLRCHGGIG